MNDISIHDGAQSPFDSIRQTRPDGSEFWSARDLMPLLGYDKWERFAGAVERAATSLAAQGHDPAREASRVREAFGKTNQVGDNFHLSRFACYLVAMNGDPRKPEVAAAQAYFAIRTREAETATALTPIDALAQAVAILQEQDRRLTAVERDAQQALEEVRAIKPAQRDELYYSGRAWSRIRGADATLHYLRKLGAKAGAIGRAAGLAHDDVPDERYGVVNGWPLWVWDEADDAIQNGAGA